MQEVELVLKPNTPREARRICSAAIPFIHAATDPRDGVLAYLTHRKARGTESRTLENEGIRICAFLKHAGLKLEVPIPKFRFVVSKPEVYSQDELDALFAEAQPRDCWLFKTLLIRLELASRRENHFFLNSSVQFSTTLSSADV